MGSCFVWCLWSDRKSYTSGGFVLFCLVVNHGASGHSGSLLFGDGHDQVVCLLVYTATPLVLLSIHTTLTSTKKIYQTI